MARIPYAPAGTPGADHSMNLFRMLAHSGPVLEGYARLGSALLFETVLDARLREVAILRIGLAAGAGYETAKHRVIAQGVGLTDSEIAALAPGASPEPLGPRERAVLRLTDELIDGARASDDALAEARRHLDDRALVELVVTIGFYALTCRVLETLGVDPEERT